jgi:hypothetical protein
MWASPTETDTFLNNLPTGVNAWLLEQGAIHATFGSDANADVSQSRRVAYLVDQLANPRPQIERVYYYFYWAPYPPSVGKHQDWALFAPGPTTALHPEPPRPAYYQYRCRTNPSTGACPAPGSYPPGEP